jgi:uncharacterized protein YbjT (DUF2867 family)
MAPKRGSSNCSATEETCVTILVAGATGTVGREVARALLQRGERVRALVRDEARARSILGDAVELAIGDFTDPPRLRAAFRSVDKAVMLAPNTPDQGVLERNLIDAAKDAGVQQVVELSGLGADLGSPARIARCHAQVEQAIAASGIPYTVLRPNTFMQNFLSMVPTVRTEGLRLPMGLCRVSLVDVRDIAAVAAVVLTQPGHDDAIYEITGPEALSFAEIGEILSQAAGRSIEYTDVLPDVFKSDLRRAGWPEWQTEAVTELYLYATPSSGAVVTTVIAEITGKQPTSFDAFAKEHAAVFRGASAPA